MTPTWRKIPKRITRKHFCVMQSTALMLNKWMTISNARHPYFRDSLEWNLFRMMRNRADTVRTIGDTVYMLRNRDKHSWVPMARLSNWRISGTDRTRTFLFLLFPRSLRSRQLRAILKMSRVIERLSENDSNLVVRPFCRVSAGGGDGDGDTLNGRRGLKYFTREDLSVEAQIIMQQTLAYESVRKMLTLDISAINVDRYLLPNGNLYNNPLKVRPHADKPINPNGTLNNHANTYDQAGIERILRIHLQSFMAFAEYWRSKIDDMELEMLGATTWFLPSRARPEDFVVPEWLVDAWRGLFLGRMATLAELQRQSYQAALMAARQKERERRYADTGNFFDALGIIRANLGK